MEYNSNFSTLALLIIKDARFARQIHQGFIAQKFGKTPSAWTKIENGQTQLTVDFLYGACDALQLRPVDVMYLIERLTALFNQQKTFFHYGSNETDDLLPFILDFFNKAHANLVSNRHTSGYLDTFTLLQPFGGYVIPSIVRYCTEPKYKEWADNGAEGFPPNDPSIISLY